ncbi:MAG: hypothetical protein H0U90_08355 [Actinobacteria bacterium]|nr:hypothetical protein [Actinomycetota bacterium]
MDVLPAQTADVELELVRLAQALFGVELDPVRLNTPERSLARLAGRLEKGQRAAAATRLAQTYNVPPRSCTSWTASGEAFTRTFKR